MILQFPTLIPTVLPMTFPSVDLNHRNPNHHNHPHHSMTGLVKKLIVHLHSDRNSRRGFAKTLRAQKLCC